MIHVQSDSQNFEPLTLGIQNNREDMRTDVIKKVAIDRFHDPL